MFITLEGIDGSGKTTQLNLLKEYLESQNEKVITLREPGGTEFTEKIRELLLNKSYELNSFTELMLFEASRSYLVENVIKPKLEEGYFVICDRFFDSTTAYQGFGRGLEINFIEKCNQMAVKSIIPNITFYFSINLESKLQRIGKRENDRIEQSGEEFYRNVINGFDQLADSHKDRIVTIDALKSIDEIHTLIKTEINKLKFKN